jgi:hypothetical protein
MIGTWLRTWRPAKYRHPDRYCVQSMRHEHYYVIATPNGMNELDKYRMCAMCSRVEKMS